MLLALPGTVGSETAPIVVGMSAAFQGPSRGLGIELYRGAAAYLQSVNRRGGVRGRPVVIKPYDDSYQPTPAIANTIRLVDKDEAFLLFGYVGTPTVTRVLPVLKTFESLDILLLFPFTGAQPQREPPYDRFVFNLRASYRQETEGLVDHLVAVGRKRIGVYYQIDAYGRSGWDGVRRALGDQGLKIASEATYRRGAAFSESFREQVDILRRPGADAVICIGAYPACAGFIRDARRAGWNVPIANVSFVGSESLLELLRPSGHTQGLINSQVVPSYTDTTLPGVREYRSLMEGAPMPPRDVLGSAAYPPIAHSFVSMEGFLDARLLVELLRRMGPKLERSRIRPVMESMRDLDLGIGAPVSFGPDRNQGLDTIYYTTVEEGRFVPLTDWSAFAP
ncbi:MAG: ABC transporter substrate-binding protein [Armatimonadetes bacterium]|nr:ABC transporter substrate-binding protein [Armatimonadota bacterium]